MTTEATGASGAGADDLDLFEEEATGQAPSTKTERTEGKTVPDKYSGKSVDDLIKMHQNAERKIATQGAELGTVRRLADQLLDLKKPTTQTTEERKPVTVDALLNDPEKAIRDAVANSDVMSRATRAEARVEHLESSITQDRFVSRYPNYKSDMDDPTFLEWVNKSQLRQALAARASATDKNDFAAAASLWEMWEERQELAGGASKEGNASPNKATDKKVPVTVRQGAADNQGGVKRKPIWSRAKLMELRTKVQQGDPASLQRWNDPGFQERMHEAYAEERVK